MSFAVILLKPFLEDLSQNINDCEIAVNTRTLLALIARLEYDSATTPTKATQGFNFHFFAN